MHRSFFLVAIGGAITVPLAACSAQYSSTSATGADAAADATASDGSSAAPSADASVEASADAMIATVGDASDDADAAPPCVPQTKATYDVVEDVAIASMSDQNFGSLPIANVGLGAFLLKFTLSAAAISTIATSSAKTRIMLTLPRAQTSNECNGSCTGPSYASSGTMRIYPVRADWIESQATWIHRQAGVAWEAPGASGGTDRGAVAGTASFAADDASITISADGNAFASWLGATTLAVVVDLASGKYVSTAREAVATSTTTPNVAPSLTVVVCQ